MRTPVLPCLLFVLFACNSGDKKTTQESTTRADSTVNSGIGIKPVHVTATQLPKTIKLRGKVVDALEWNDKLGENLFVTTRVEPFPDKQMKSADDEESVTGELHAYHFIKKDTGFHLLWIISDEEKGCPFDITSDFIKGSTAITDLDQDGIAETLVQYKIACRSDVSPAYMKLILHEDVKKYSLQGMMWIQAGPEEVFTVTEKDVNLEKMPKKKDEYEAIMQSFGRYETEKEFASAPPEFLSYARAQWMKYVKESFD